MVQGTGRGNFTDEWPAQGRRKKLRAAAFIATYDGEPPFICNQCPVSLRPRRGCTSPLDNPYKLDMEQGPDGVVVPRYEFDYCPVNYVDPDHKDLLGLFGLWKQGKMLIEGGISDQPAKYIDVMTMLDGLWAKAERDAIDKASKGRGSSLPTKGKRRG